VTLRRDTPERKEPPMSPEQPGRGTVPGDGGHWVASDVPGAPHQLPAAAGFADDEQRDGRRELLVGAVILAIGLAVTIGSYIAAGNAAEQSGSGTYVVTWGLIVVGAVKTVKGLYRMLS
jgi:hypothetical protein